MVATTSMPIRAQSVDRILAAIDAHGYCVVPGVLSAARADQLRALVDELRVREPRPDVAELGHHRVLRLASRHPAFVWLLCHPLVLAVWARLLGEDFVCSSWTSNTVSPRSGRAYWHVDHPYWTIAPPYPVEPALTGQTIWCLDDFSVENGATRFVPGSHRRPFLPEHNGDYDHEAVPIEAARGSVVFAHGACWHTMAENGTDAPRTGIFGTYARSYIVLQDDMKAQVPAIENPSPLVRRLLGAMQYAPQTGSRY